MISNDHIVFEGHGITILLKDGRYYIRYDEGEIVVKIVEREISVSEAEAAKKGEAEAYNVLIAVQSRS